MFSNPFIKNTKTIDLHNVGPVLLIKSKRARHLRITVSPFKGVRVSVPYSISYARAEEFVSGQIHWLVKHLNRMKREEEDYQQSNVRLLQLDRSRARLLLINRLEELAGQHGFSYNRVFIRNQTTLWGSCSARNNINLNLKLALLPQQLMDYVILHELVHTRIKNHSRKFWIELARYFPDPKSASKNLRKSGLGTRV